MLTYILIYVSTEKLVWRIKLLIVTDNLQKQRIEQTRFTIEKIKFMYEVPYLIALVIADRILICKGVESSGK